MDVKRNKSLEAQKATANQGKYWSHEPEQQKNNFVWKVSIGWQIWGNSGCFRQLFMSSQLSFKLGCPEKVLSLFKKGSIVSFMNNSMEHDKEMVSSFIQIFFIEPLSKILVIKIRRQSRKFLKKKNVSSFKFNISGSNFYRYIRYKTT